jgi:AraC-like DNA-binding protein
VPWQDTLAKPNTKCAYAPVDVVANEIAVMRQLQRLLQLARLFDCIKDALVWVKDRDGRYCWVNRAFLLNYAMARPRGDISTDSEGVLGKTDYDLSPTFLADQYRLDDEQVLTGKWIVNRIELVGEPEGVTVWNVTNKIPLTDTDGAVIGTAGITQRLDMPGQPMVSGTEFGPVLAYMRDHYHEPITNQQLARLAHMSVRAFERKFCSSFHNTPQKYLRKLRLRMASRALVYTNLPLAKVALSCGFVDQSHFSREFRRLFGRTPRNYRAHYSLGTTAAASGTIPAALEQSSASPSRLSSNV